MSDTRAKVESLRERIQDSNDISEQDREVLFKFSDTIYLLKSEYTDHRHDKLLRHCTRIAEEVGGLADTLEAPAAAIQGVNQSLRNITIGFI